jgi:hypothetical protein
VPATLTHRTVREAAGPNVLSSSWATSHPSWEAACENRYEYLRRTGCPTDTITPIEYVGTVNTMSETVAVYATYGDVETKAGTLRVCAVVLGDMPAAALPEPTEAEQAYALGFTAYGTPGACAAPALDGTLMALIGNVPVGQPRTIGLMTEWLHGWQDAATEAADAVLAPVHA